MMVSVILQTTALMALPGIILSIPSGSQFVSTAATGTQACCLRGRRFLPASMIKSAPGSSFMSSRQGYPAASSFPLTCSFFLLRVAVDITGCFHVFKLFKTGNPGFDGGKIGKIPPASVWKCKAFRSVWLLL